MYVFQRPIYVNLLRSINYKRLTSGFWGKKHSLLLLGHLFDHLVERSLLVFVAFRLLRGRPRLSLESRVCD